MNARFANRIEEARRTHQVLTEAFEKLTTLLTDLPEHIADMETAASKPLSEEEALALDYKFTSQVNQLVSDVQDNLMRHGGADAIDRETGCWFHTLVHTGQLLKRYQQEQQNLAYAAPHVQAAAARKVQEDAAKAAELRRLLGMEVAA